MILRLRTATLVDVYTLAQDLSEISKGELTAMFGSNWWEALKLVKDFLKAGPADVLVADGKPVCALGHMPHSGMENTRITWFLASQAYFDMGARGVVYGRNYMKKLQRDYPGTVFYSYTRSPHSEVGRWFRACGMSYSGQVEGARAYVLPLPSQSDKKTGSTRA